MLAPPRIINGYGPTETVITPMIWEAYAQDSMESAYAPIELQSVTESCMYLILS
nr:hypothetical protein [Vibrio sp. ED004]